MRAALVLLSENVEILGNREHDLLAIINDDAGNTYLTLFLDGVKLGAMVAVLEKLLEGEHAARNVDGCILDACFIQRCLQRAAVFAVLAVINDDFFHGLRLLL